MYSSLGFDILSVVNVGLWWEIKMLGICTTNYTILWICTLKSDIQHIVLYITYLQIELTQFTSQCKACYTLVINNENLSLGNNCTKLCVVQTAGGVLGELVFLHCSPCRAHSLTERQQVLLCIHCRENRSKHVSREMPSRAERRTPLWMSYGREISNKALSEFISKKRMLVANFRRDSGPSTSPICVLSSCSNFDFVDF